MKQFRLVLRTDGNYHHILRIIRSIDKDLRWLIGDLDSINDDVNQSLERRPHLEMNKDELFELLKKGHQWIWGTFIGYETNLVLDPDMKILSEFAPDKMQLPESLIEIRILDGCEIEIISKDPLLIRSIKKQNENKKTNN